MNKSEIKENLLKVFDKEIEKCDNKKIKQDLIFLRAKVEIILRENN